MSAISLASAVSALALRACEVELDLLGRAGLIALNEDTKPPAAPTPFGQVAFHMRT